MEIKTGGMIELNAPEFFEDPAFMAWLNNGKTKMTWHTKGNAVADEYSDVVVFVEPSLNGEGSEGSDATMPQYIWEKIVDVCREHFARVASTLECQIAVRITNLEE